MLQHIRDRAQSWIAIAIIALLIIGLSTVAWDAYFSPDPDVPVAKVNGEKITANEFQRAYQQQRARLQNMLGGADISQFIPDEDEFKRNVLKRIEEEKLILQAALDAGYRVSDALLAQQIRSFEVFQSDGQFAPALYQQWLNQNFMSPGTFEDMLRRDGIIQQYRLAIAATSWSTEQENRRLYGLQEQRRDVGYIRIPAADYLDQASVSDEDIKAYYEENSARYATPEKVSIKYLELSIANLTRHVDVNEGKLRELYQERRSEFGVPEERRTRHILIEVPGAATETEVEAARKQAQALYEQIQAGESFEALAREHSDDIGSANDGGDLGYMARDTMMDPALADAAFSLAEGEVSRPVRSAYGFHLIKVEDIKRGQSKSFEEVRAQLEQDYRHRQAEDMFFEQGEILANLTFENPDTLEVAAEELELSIKQTPLFSREQGSGIASNPDVRSTAFSDEVLMEGLNSQVLELNGDRVVVLRVDEHQESAIRPFEEVRQQITDQLRQEGARAMAEEAGQEILDTLAEDVEIQAIAEQRELSWNHPEPIKRNDPGLDAKVARHAFQMPRPDEASPSYAGLTMSNGDYAIIALFKVIDGDIESADENVIETINAERERYYGATELLGSIGDMRQSAEIKEYLENL